MLQVLSVRIAVNIRAVTPRLMLAYPNTVERNRPEKAWELGDVVMSP